MLPLVDVVILLFGFMTILLISARFQEVDSATKFRSTAIHITPAAAVDSKTDAVPTAVLQAIAEGRIKVFTIDIDKDLKLQQVLPQGAAGGTVDAPEASLTKQIKAVPESDRLVICRYPQGFDSRRFTPKRQEQLKNSLGGSNVVYFVNRSTN